QAQRLPGGAGVGGEEDAAAVTGEAQALVLGFLADGVQAGVLRQALGEALPAVAEVGRAEQVRPGVVHPVGVYDDVGGAGVERGRLDAGHGAPLGQALDVVGDIGPVLAAVAADVDQAVVATGPEHL